MKGKKNKGRRLGDGAGGWRMAYHATYQSHRLLPMRYPDYPQQTKLFHL